GRKAFSAMRSSTTESLPPENSRAGFVHSAATSRMMWMASDSSQSRWRLWAASRKSLSTAVFMAFSNVGDTKMMRRGWYGRSDRGGGLDAYQLAVNDVQAAFLGFRILPPPAAGAHV